MGMGLRRGRRGGRRGRRFGGKRRRRRGGRGGLGKLFLCCFGTGQQNQVELNRDEILQLQQSQQMMIFLMQQHASQQQGGQGMMTTPNFSAGQTTMPSGFQTSTTYGVQQPNQYGTPMASGYPSGFAPGTTGQTSGFGATNTVGPANIDFEAAGKQILTDHQNKQLALLNEIQQQLSVETDPVKHTELSNQYNELVAQMRAMEAQGCTYPAQIPPPLHVAQNTYGTGLSNAPQTAGVSNTQSFMVT